MFAILKVICLCSIIFLLFSRTDCQYSINDSLSILPQNSATRSFLSLDGIWNFRLQNDDENGFAERWFDLNFDSIDGPIERMPVPSSFNDITQNRAIRDFAGWVWYQRSFVLPSVWPGNNGFDNRVESEHKHNSESVLRFGSVNYRCFVWLNGQLVTQHVGGHLPFQAAVTTLLKFSGSRNWLTVAVNNELSGNTLPPGQVRRRPDYRVPGRNITEMLTNFDFFPYSGIHRSVILHSLPPWRIVDLTVRSDVGKGVGILEYSVQTNVGDQSRNLVKTRVKLLDKANNIVGTLTGNVNLFSINNVKLWHPFPGVGNEMAGYRYRMIVELYNNTVLIDSMEHFVGIRRVDLYPDGFHINGRRVYLRGFGCHEDENIRGRGLSTPTLIKDFNLMKWTGANSFRTSHYPYSEELMEEADAQGFLVINEVPAVGLEHESLNNSIILKQHLKTVRELIDRDKNRPSVIAWSIANEPRSDIPLAGPYFEKIANKVRQCDSKMQRPITAAISVSPLKDFASWSLDFVMINRYFGWYSDAGYVQVIRGELIDAVKQFINRFRIPAMISEYGADTIPGLHSDPSLVFSEEYQVEFLYEYHFAFDKLRADKQLIGEHIWNFADFQTRQDITRVGGNRKGIFTRDRRPKTAASVLRCRYWSLAEDLHPSIDQYHRQGVALCPKVVL